MKQVSDRMILYTKDIANITGKSSRTARTIAAKIKKLNYAAFVTLEAFCAFTGLKEEKVKQYLASN